MIPLLLIITQCVTVPNGSWIVPQPKTNVWRVLAQALGQDNICLSLDSAANLASTCLVGIPFKSNEFPPSLAPASFFPAYDPLVPWDQFVKRLPEIKDELHEFELLGSTKAPCCVHFMVKPNNPRIRHTEIKQFKSQYMAKNWCEKIAHIHDTLAITMKPRSVPCGNFFVFGDQAFAGIPSHLAEGPCTTGWACFPVI